MPLPLSAHDASFARAARAVLVCAGGICLVACGDDAPLQQAREDFRVVEGGPRVEVTPPRVDEQPADPGPFQPSRPRRCDWFTQQARRPVDVLFVVDDSASMGDEQRRLAALAGDVIDRLGGAPGADFHLGVVTTDVDRLDRSRNIGPGWLRGTRVPFLACTSDAADQGIRVACNVGDRAAAAAELARMLQPGIDGSQQEKGLLAAMLALSQPEPGVRARNAGFLRDEAALAIVFVSDEEDASCGPYQPSAAACLASPSCKCEDSPTWGSVAYYDRFFRGLKGYGNEDAVRIGAIVATDEVELNFDDDSGRRYVGCTTGGPQDSCVVPGVPGQTGVECAFRAPRYAAVADADATVDICSDLGSALAGLPLEGSGLRSEFALGRRAVCGTIDVMVVPHPSISCEDAASCPTEAPECVNRKPDERVCARRVPGGLSQGWEYVICSGGTQRNVVRFSGRSIPEPLHEIEVCYDVDVEHDS